MKNLKNAIDYLSMNDSNGNYSYIYNDIKENKITLEQAKQEVADILNRWIDESLSPGDASRETIEKLIQSLMQEKEGR